MPTASGNFTRVPFKSVVLSRFTGSEGANVTYLDAISSVQKEKLLQVISAPPQSTLEGELSIP